MEAPQGGFFLSSKQPYSKIATSLKDQVELMVSRGLVIDDTQKAEHYLKFIGYYRLGGYARHFRVGSGADPERYIHGTTFSDVLDLYIFDRKMRLLMFDAIERVEVAVRAAISNAGSLSGGGPFWLTDANNFDYGRHGIVTREIEAAIGDVKSGSHQHPFIEHFYNKYSDVYPPSWMLMECFSIGSISKIYKIMKGNLRQTVAREFNLQHDVLESWLHSISHSRNICAHHSRCWKRIFTIKAKIPKSYRKNIPENSENKLYSQCWMLAHFMKIIADGSRWPERLSELIVSRPKTSLLDMGFPEDWRDHEFWGLPKQK